uniref:50S ribosomal protein L23 n=1 Tax=Nephromyces sp. ex Molgula occidentalis TaxID=2544991 RepID=A0A5C1H853_9APIC|nr:hypothetical protein [Nephromyces sp. ex Molgula occidentalis]
MIKELIPNLSFLNIKSIEKISFLKFNKIKIILIVPFNLDKNYLKYNLEFLLNIKIIKLNSQKLKFNSYLKKITITYSHKNDYL